MLKKSFILLTVALLVMGILSGCSSTTDNTEVITEKGYPVTVKDDTGHEVTIESEPTRIISLMPSITETLFALGLEDKVIGVTKFDNYPENVQEKVEYVFQDGLKPNVEQIVNLQPDLILLGSLNEELASQLNDLNIPVVTLKPQNLDAVYQSIETLGIITNTQEKADEVVQAMKEKEASIIKKVTTLDENEKVRVWVEVSPDLWTAGKGTFMDELITKAGGINIVDQDGWIQYTEEKILDANPQVILTTYSYYVPNPSETILNREGWQDVEAVQTKHIVDLDSDLVTRTGPRIVDGFEEIAKALYPDLFK